jgi:hypothetical protein
MSRGRLTVRSTNAPDEEVSRGLALPQDLERKPLPNAAGGLDADRPFILRSFEHVDQLARWFEQAVDGGNHVLSAEPHR